MCSQSVYYLWIECDAIEDRIDLSEVIDWMMVLFGSSFLFAKKVQHMGGVYRNRSQASGIR